MWLDLYKTAFRYLLKLGLPYTDAEDIAQEALLSTYLHLDSIQEGKLKTYLLTTAKHKYIDFLRKNGREFITPIISDFCMSEFAQIHQIENKDVMQRALNKLNLNEQKLFYMKYNLELTNAEISSLLKTTPGSVKVMLYRIRKKLKEYLEGEAES
jgi:RNA polymerase sigma-70 factor (ECF subfamily)